MRTWFLVLGGLWVIGGVFAGVSWGLGGGGEGGQSGLSSPLATKPDWSWLRVYEGKVSREDVVRALKEQYAFGDVADRVLEVGAEKLRVRASGGWEEVRFRGNGKRGMGEGGAEGDREGRYWRKASELGKALPGKPLAGVRIAIDPGHLGGRWAQMEERYFQLGKSQAVMEGDLTWKVALRLKPQLERLGAEVQVLRKGDRPVTTDRAEGLREVATADLGGGATASRIRSHSEMLFYRVSEIRARAALVNEKVRPDLVLCLHLNAEEWGEATDPKLVPRNHLHALVNGSYGARELEYEDVRSEMLQRVLSGVDRESIAVSERVVAALAKETGLPPYTYFSNNAHRVGSTAYLYARNLLATRLYMAPVVFLEPYVMNSEPVWKRVQWGDYEGTRLWEGVPRKSLFAEYADGVVAGLVAYYTEARRSP